MQTSNEQQNHPANALSDALQKTLSGQLSSGDQKLGDFTIGQAQQTGNKLQVQLTDAHGNKHDCLIRVHKIVDDNASMDPTDTMSIRRNEVTGEKSDPHAGQNQAMQTQPAG